MREIISFVFCALCMVCPGKALSWNHKDCNRQSNATSARHWVN